MELEGIDHVALSVRDVERSAQWYIDVLGFEKRYADVWGGVPTFVGKATTAIALFPARGIDYKKCKSHDKIRMLHLAFRADRKNFLAAQEDLERHGIRFEFQ